MNSNFVGRTALCAVGVLALAAGSASAGVVWNASAGTRAASADFSSAAGQLKIILSNDALGDAMMPDQMLTGVFFDIAGAPLALSRISVTIAAGSGAFIGVAGGPAPTDPGDSVGGEWAYNSGIAGPHGADYGVSSSGLGLFGPGDRFAGNNLQGPASPDGVQYGITNAGDNILTGNGGLNGEGLIKHAVVIILDGVGPNFDLSSIGNVSFQYGTGLSEPNLPGAPTPGAMALLGISGLLVSRRRR